MRTPDEGQALRKPLFFYYGVAKAALFLLRFCNAAPCCGIFIVGTYKILAVKPPKFGDLA
ncbi:hypothetical protein LTSESEN_4050 [Salmonella enterica subsp. enterica serovar Senftenberg str. A4-543]|uniref:Uncharacterized protein n=1 Tax=Salmonella enterica subsp. enterica serovar Senftenberg str. A4-543 TaxID=913082 RepID=G5R3I3_SALSE|nr:hypothetical protein LTSESEN_4050 [Salmonella enterica subsp. enterica serovar Senftenberg str. A4-543]